jgi:chromosome segregation ATPase
MSSISEDQHKAKLQEIISARQQLDKENEILRIEKSHTDNELKNLKAKLENIEEEQARHEATLTTELEQAKAESARLNEESQALKSKMSETQNDMHKKLLEKDQKVAMLTQQIEFKDQTLQDLKSEF